MVGKWAAMNPLTIEERYLVKEAIDMDLSYSQMALHVGRCKSVMIREVQRLGKPCDYDPKKAQKDFEYKQTLIGIKKKKPRARRSK